MKHFLCPSVALRDNAFAGSGPTEGAYQFVNRKRLGVP
jgi:hypothetical protein